MDRGPAEFGRVLITSADEPMDVMITLQPMNNVQAAADLVWSKMPRNYPGSKVALSEGGIGWFPYFPGTYRLQLRPPSSVDRPGFGDKLP